MTSPSGGYDRSRITEDFKLLRPYLALVGAVLVLAVVVPGTRRASERESIATESQAAAGATTGAQGTDTTSIGGSTAPAGVAVVAGASGGARAGGAAKAGSTATATRVAPALAGSSGTGFVGTALDAPDCDKSTGRIAIPSFYAPNCVPMWSKQADNGGNTWQGVTKDSIKVAVYRGQTDPAAQAIVVAAGGASQTSPEEDWENRKKMVEAYLAHYETYGRKVELVAVDGSGEADDDAAGKADAIKVAAEIKAFASFGAPNNAYIDELVARKVMCLSCSVSLPQENYEKWSPYVWSDLMASTQGYVHRSEYICKKVWGRNATFAGDPTYKALKRKMAIVYYELADGSYKKGVDFFDQQLAKCGARMDDHISYILDLAKAQEDARVIIGRLKDKGITSVFFSGDPLMPIFLTQEATRQAYFPEWVVSGSALTDTAFFARTYDPQQWKNAFGVSYLVARVDPAVADAEGDLFSWHYGQKLTSTPSALPMDHLFRGVMLAGPKLTPQTFRDGMFGFKGTSGYLTRFGVSFGTGLWGGLTGPDYVSADDATEIWWDPQAVGPDESANRNVASGLYRYVDGGKRFLPGAWPGGDTKAFQVAGTVLIYPERPAQDRFPNYPRREGLRNK